MAKDQGALFVLSCLLLVYSLGLLGWAVYTYYKNKSKATLIAGGLIGLALLGSVIATFAKPQDIGAWAAQDILTLIVAGFTGARWRCYADSEGGHKFLPVGLLFVCSGVAFILAIIATIIVAT